MKKRFLRICVGIAVVAVMAVVAWLVLTQSRKVESVPLTELRIGQEVRVGPVAFRIDSVKQSKSGFHYFIKRNGDKTETELKQIAIKGVIRNVGNDNVCITEAVPIGISGRVISKDIEVLSVPMSDLIRKLEIGPGQAYQFDSEVSSLRETECLFYWQIKLSTGSKFVLGYFRIAI